jgi:hypothetical protein
MLRSNRSKTQHERYSENQKEKITLRKRSRNLTPYKSSLQKEVLAQEKFSDPLEHQYS